MAYSAIAVANAFIQRAKDRGITDLTPMKLQKLVFYAHAWSLVMSNKPLVKDKVYAWPYGPVIESIYHEFKDRGSHNITTPGTEFIWDDSPDALIEFRYVTPQIPNSDELTQSIVDSILDAYGDQSAIALSNLTHRPGSAWFSVVEEHGGGEPRNLIIPNDVIKECTSKELGFSD
ncbi:Panacea domain-containing protein [Pantoea vagans]|uniref:Panacea domain-containing protein n=1 Tax=Pantoea vagans TaxID=470934 RepID=UPI003AAEDF66